MLTPDFINNMQSNQPNINNGPLNLDQMDQILNKYKSTTGTNGTKSSSNQSMTPEQANQWIDSLTGKTNTTPAKAPTPDLGSRVASDFQQSGDEASRILNDPTEGNAVTRGVKVAAQGARAVAAPITETAKSVWNAVPTALQQLFTGTPEQQKSFADKQANSPTNPIEAKINSALFNWSQEHPDAYNKLKNTLGGIAAGGEIAGTVAAGEAVPETGITKASEIPGALKSTATDFASDVKAGAKSTANSIKNGVNTATNKIDSAIMGSKTANPANTLQKEFDTIQDKISPKPTAKEIKLAQSQGRLVKGKEPTILKKGTGDTITPTKDTQRAVGTIQREIPGAAKMDEPTLHDALKNKISEKAEALKPEMQKVKIQPSTVEKINNDWESLKSSQIKNARATEEPNVMKRQQQFESFLKKSQSGDMNDLWDTAKNYDDSIPSNVKKANDASARDLQDEKQEWLDNRAILKSAINDTKTGLGKLSEQAFSDMHDMYNAKENLISKAKLDLEGKPSKLNQALTGKTAKVVGAVVGAGYAVPKIVKAATGQ